MADSALLDYAVQPYSGTDVIAFVMAISALSCGVIRWRDQERGMGWFALSMGALAVWVAANNQHLPVGPELNPSPWYLLMCLAMGAMGPGLAAYLNLPRPQRLRAMLAVVLPSAAFAGLVLWVMFSDARLPRVWIHLLTAMAFSAMAWQVMAASRLEPGAGYVLLGAALLTVPGLALLLVVTRADPVAIRYWAVFPAMLIGLALPSVSVLRRRRSLQAENARRHSAERGLAELNRSLERQVTDRTSALQQMVAGLESFNRSISHDLRGPLGGIAGLARLASQAMEKGDPARAERALPLIAHQAETSGRLVAALLELARVGEVTLQRQPVDPAQLAGEVIEQLRQSGTAAMPRFVLHALPQVQTDPDLLRAILANLIGNAVKFARSGEDGLVEVGAQVQDSGVRLFVHDNGIGFDAETATSIFKPFNRLHGQAYEGHGIGLSIVRRAVERLGGEVWAESTPGQGARFNVQLPGQA